MMIKMMKLMKTMMQMMMTTRMMLMMVMMMVTVETAVLVLLAAVIAAVVAVVLVDDNDTEQDAKIDRHKQTHTHTRASTTPTYHGFGVLPLVHGFGRACDEQGSQRPRERQTLRTGSNDTGSRRRRRCRGRFQRRAREKIAAGDGEANEGVLQPVVPVRRRRRKQSRMKKRTATPTWRCGGPSS